MEVKDRAFDHDRYGDVVVEDTKRQCTRRRIDAGQFDGAMVASVYQDGVVVLCNLFDNRARLIEKQAPTTTLVRGGPTRFIGKTFVSLPNDVKFRFSRLPGGGFKFTKI